MPFITKILKNGYNIMSNNIDLKKGLNIPLNGEAALKTRKTILADVIAIKPTDFRAFSPRLLVRVGDKVLAGSPILADKKNPNILITSPASGTVSEIVRGSKRKLLEIRITTDKEQQFVEFNVPETAKLTGENVKEILLESGLWASIIQRPYGVIANPEVSPKAIFISGFNTAPLAANTEFVLKDEISNFQKGVTALSKLTHGGVHLSLNAKNYSSTPLHKLEDVILHVINGDKHPAGNVGVQISHISPITREDIVWTIPSHLVVAIGKLFKNGKLDLTRKIAVTGPKAIEPAYVEGIPGISMKDIKEFYDNSEKNIRFISGDVLSGENIGEEGFLGYFDNQITLIKEGNETELFGWAKPFRTKIFSASRSYFSWLTPNKKYDLDTNLHGGPRAFVMSDVYSKVLPMDIFPVFLLKACLAKDIDKMEQFGIYEVIPEDFALCEYVDPSKIYIQDIISKGIDLMIKEMA